MTTSGLAGFQRLEYLIDIFKFGFVNVRAHFAFSRECNRLCQVLSGADDGAADRDALQHHIEDRGCKFPRRQAGQAYSAFAPHERECLVERRD